MKIKLIAITPDGTTGLNKMIDAYKTRHVRKGFKDSILKTALVRLKLTLEQASETPLSLVYYTPELLARDSSQLTPAQEDKLKNAIGLDLIKYGCSPGDVEVLIL